MPHHDVWFTKLTTSIAATTDRPTDTRTTAAHSSAYAVALSLSPFLTLVLSVSILPSSFLFLLSLAIDQSDSDISRASFGRFLALRRHHRPFFESLSFPSLDLSFSCVVRAHVSFISNAVGLALKFDSIATFSRPFPFSFQHPSFFFLPTFVLRYSLSF